MLDQLPLGADLVERLQSDVPSSRSGRNRLPSGSLVEPLELRIERGQRVIYDRTDRDAAGSRRDALLDGEAR